MRKSYPLKNGHQVLSRQTLTQIFPQLRRLVQSDNSIAVRIMPEIWLAQSEARGSSRPTG